MIFTRFSGFYIWAKKKLKPEILLSCIDVLCKANVSLRDTDSRLATEISEAIQALTHAIENYADKEEEGVIRRDNAKKQIKSLEDTVVDLFTNEIIYRGSKKIQK